jgi:superoxide dismutase, Cu-Zn family
MVRHCLSATAVIAVIAVCVSLSGNSPLPTSGNKALAQQPARRGEMQRNMQRTGMPAVGAQPSREVTKAICVIHPLSDSKVAGKVTFVKQASGIEMKVEVTGLTPGEHGFHIHEWGDCSSADGMSTGGHYNPTNHPHAGPEAAERHAGDFGNITADASGKATLSRIDKMLALDGPNSIIGRAIVVHAGRDDLTSQPSGNAGGRIGCGVIGVANPAAQ